MAIHGQQGRSRQQNQSRQKPHPNRQNTTNFSQQRQTPHATNQKSRLCQRETHRKSQILCSKNRAVISNRPHHSSENRRQGHGRRLENRLLSRHDVENHGNDRRDNSNSNSKAHNEPLTAERAMTNIKLGCELRRHQHRSIAFFFLLQNKKTYFFFPRYPTCIHIQRLPRGRSKTLSCPLHEPDR